ncbi:dihydrofolate reductase family protein [Kribbella sp. NPDC006257]|uniref:dihydrofolate reductase family protein n=1 Tax=Kribbella sp. NPDC006257 TaxID=3156738 RepID=UPI0033BA2F67
MRKLIAGMQVSVDGKIAGSEGFADWVDEWGDNYELMPRIDACLLGGGMYPGHEQYWTAIEQAEPGKPLPFTGTVPTPAEIEWARFAAQVPHYVLSKTLTKANWPRTTFLRSTDEVAALKDQPGKDIYLIGGARTTTGLLEAGLVDELHLHIHPLIAGDGTALFPPTGTRRPLTLRTVHQLPNGRVNLVYEFG